MVYFILFYGFWIPGGKSFLVSMGCLTCFLLGGLHKLTNGISWDVGEALAATAKAQETRFNQRGSVDFSGPHGASRDEELPGLVATLTKNELERSTMHF